MSDYDDDTTNPGDLRDALKKANKMIADLKAENEQIKVKVRSVDIKEALQSLKVHPKVAKLIPADVEPTPEAVKAWVDEFADVFGITTNEPDASEEPATPTQTDVSSVPQEYVQAMTMAAQTASTGIPPAPDPKGIEGKLDSLAGKSFAEIEAAIREMQNLKG